MSFHEYQPSCSGTVPQYTDVVPAATCEDAFTSPHLPTAMERDRWSVNQFVLRRQIYKGKTSRVFEAVDILSGLPIALKLYRKHRLTALNRVQVAREIDIHVTLGHKSIVQLYAAFEDDSNVYLVQELANHGDLFQMVRAGDGRFSERSTIQTVIIPLLDCLSYLHYEGIIHRDIKPENLLVFASCTIKLADFGLAIDANEERPVTRTGTLDYMCPEVLACPDKVFPDENKGRLDLEYTTRVDVWAVGVLAYELMVGFPPFERDTRLATYESILQNEPVFPPWLSLESISFITMALCKDPTKRASVRQLQKHVWLQPFTAADAPSMTNVSAEPQLSIWEEMDLPTPPATPNPYFQRMDSCPVSSSTEKINAFKTQLSSFADFSLFDSPTRAEVKPGLVKAGAGPRMQAPSSANSPPLAEPCLSLLHTPSTPRNLEPSPPHSPLLELACPSPRCCPSSCPRCPPVANAQRQQQPRSMQRCLSTSAVSPLLPLSRSAAASGF